MPPVSGWLLCRWPRSPTCKHSSTRSTGLEWCGCSRCCFRSAESTLREQTFLGDQVGIEVAVAGALEQHGDPTLADVEHGARTPRGVVHAVAGCEADLGDRHIGPPVAHVASAAR